MADGPLLIGVVGWKNSGKTTLVERLIPLLTARGLKVATVKHTHHELRPPDGATDGERHARAGAITTIVLAPTAWEIDGHRQEDAPPAFGDLAAHLAGVDIVLVEGFKSAPISKIEVRRRASPTQEPLAVRDHHVIAIATDHPTETSGQPLFDLDDAEAIADFIAVRAR
ncbi:MAG: molybdopterin-guanine dinucleotide biosynthesis protein B [Hyphomicrobium sp.]